MSKYLAWKFSSITAAEAAHQKLMNNLSGQPVSVSRFDCLVVVICDNRDSYRAAKRQKILNGEAVSLEDDLVDLLVQRRRAVAPREPGKMARILTTDDGRQITWIA